ncbi:MAG: Glycosyl transferase family 2 [Candidatus Gottesmanbacteria bacterium GW2011_GWB1_43_11]|uniref:Glycosyl transferase family 2 n=1 Tax=Candidatus Gottesmanbacteria bacterium GW2011_GWB1_43_11 TaxID=1618446 RepID=A0A0G1CPN5_9BACT|nr:MAG: Glycosyl transferase family 2 [Candidatus Gottesmanbacteria bacterium GW2011_GWA2_42_16]KKS56235.1 MAG: Glycosyl transferase family 2 [Candidatus Gottesmanbacteria bacterium GW2011_GWA1_42_26]KKS82568.1 MAG: Glycosyl transferase family 2 [Candidatus Gottesmanbacteria bacterium GW2011_GWC1_43_10]KKS87437.1 MAG: Glycosyl transferase family 2 [Candidatus Gottesmanbacteria bacterium GW2011_GWB1_43_11]OGG10188.1 MAG: hypothetical protein A2699_01415 [Candidatus Gottesmanbacteria bacterium RI
MPRLLLLIPAFNEAAIIGEVLDGLPRQIHGMGKIDVVVIDDGSQDNTFEIAKRKKVKVFRHSLNLGLGAVLGTGFEYAVNTGYDFVITVDADGQHQPDDVVNIAKSLLTEKSDIVIGSRSLSKKNMPLVRRLVNFLSNTLTFLLFNVWTTDSQSGLRGFTKAALKKLKIRSQRMEVSSEIFKEIGRLHLTFVEVPITAIYTDYSLTKGQPISNAPNVFWKLLLQRFA